MKIETKLHTAVLSSITGLGFGIDDLRDQKLLTEPLRKAALNEQDTREVVAGLSARLAEAERRLDNRGTRGKQLRTLREMADDLRQTIEGVRKNYVTAYNGASDRAGSMRARLANGLADADFNVLAAATKGGSTEPGVVRAREAGDLIG